MSNIVSIINGEALTTTSAIAEGTEVKHKNVLELVRRYRDDLQDFGPVAFETLKGQALPQGGFAKATEIALLNEQQATLVMTYMRNSDIVRAFKKRLVKAFYEMARKNPADSLSRVDLLKMALESEEQRLALASKVEELAPKAAFHDQCIAAEGRISLGETAKILGTGRTRLTAFMRQQRWLTRKNEPYQDRIEAGLLDVKLSHWEHPKDGIQRAVTALVTGKGLAKLQRLWAEHIAQGRAA